MFVKIRDWHNECPYLLTTQFNVVVLQTIFLMLFWWAFCGFFRWMTLRRRNYCTGVEAVV